MLNSSYFTSFCQFITVNKDVDWPALLLFGDFVDNSNPRCAIAVSLSFLFCCSFLFNFSSMYKKGIQFFELSFNCTENRSIRLKFKIKCECKRKIAGWY